MEDPIKTLRRAQIQEQRINPADLERAWFLYRAAEKVPHHRWTLAGIASLGLVLGCAMRIYKHPEELWAAILGAAAMVAGTLALFAQKHEEKTRAGRKRDYSAWMQRMLNGGGRSQKS